tara:strand:+ start:6649 stop:8475 length:1827 start_codon:yes stop_codon:yes gene_type:complete
MEPLFIKAPEFQEKTATVPLGRDASKWTKELLDAFFSEFPQFMEEDIDVEFKRKDPEKGYAVAIIRLGEFVVPVIIRNGQLPPFDVIYKNGVPLPLSQDTLADIYKNKSAFGQLVADDRDPHRDLFMNPSVNLQLGSSTIQKFSSYGLLGEYEGPQNPSMLNKMARKVSQAQKETLMTMLEDDSDVIAGFSLNGTADVLQKVASLDTQDDFDFKKSVSKHLERDVHYIYKEGRFGYKGIFGNSEIDDPLEVEIKNPAFVEKVGNIKTYATEAEGDSIPLDKAAIFNIYDSKDDQLVVFEQEGKVGHVRHHSQDVSDNAADKLDGVRPTVGTFGTFVKESSALPPFEVESVLKNKQHYEVKGWDGFNKVAYYPSKGIKAPIAHEEYNNAWYIPTDMQFVKVGEQEDMNNIIHSYKNSLEGSSHHYIKDDLGYYSFRGPEFDKYAKLGHKIDNLNIHEASWAGLQCGMSAEEVEKIAEVVNYEKNVIKSVLKSPKAIEKVSQAIQNDYKDSLTEIQTLTPNLIKCAATFTDKGAVDKILSLGLINKKNVMEFVEYIPQFEGCISYLSKMLLAIRLGLEGLPEEPVREAMHGLSKVVRLLRQIGKVANRKS